MDSVEISLSDAFKIFAELNPGKIKLDEYLCIVTDTEPKHLKYPHGWYYEDGYFTNRYETDTGFFSKVEMCHTDGSSWRVPYTTRFMDACYEY